MRTLALAMLIQAMTSGAAFSAILRTLDDGLPPRVIEIMHKQIERYLGTNDFKGVPLLDLGGGCVVVPIPGKVTSGHQHSSEALEFLRSPDTTREEVIASLGPPLLEVPESGVLLYAWEKTSRFLIIYPDRIHCGEVVLGATLQSGDSYKWDCLSVTMHRAWLLHTKSARSGHWAWRRRA